MSALLEEVVKQYLESRDFNGYYFHKASATVLAEAKKLLNEGFVQVVDENDYPNPHIRPWRSKRSTEDQLRSLEEATTGEYGACLYPTASALEGRLPPELYTDQPYRRRMAEGGGTLELAYFQFEVLETYRNDPRFEFRFYDFGAETIVSNDTYVDDTEPEHDKTSIRHIGFAYDLSKYKADDPDTPIVRRVCAFLGDLAKLTPLHQVRWSTYEVPITETLKPHPVWWGQQMGHWPDGLGPFDRFFFELRTWDELHARITGVNLLKTTERPREFGWMLRPSQHEFDLFVHQLDKLLSDNIQHAALDALRVPRKDSNGASLGSLKRLDMLLESRRISKSARDAVLKPLRNVRQARQKPAHSLSTNVNSATFVRRQADLLEEVNESLVLLRSFWQRHRANADWEEPEHVKDGRGYRL